MRALWKFLKRPAASIPAVLVLIAGGVGGVIFWGGFNTFMEHTNTMEFCISCHEMEATPYAEYKTSIHYANASGVRAICSDCHVPKAWTPKFIRKVQATAELYYHFMGKLSTPEKFEAHRLEMARSVWATMEANNSKECRNCHSYDSMDFHAQRPKSAEKMQVAFKEGETCISCHKGIAHKLPDMTAGYLSMFTALDAAASDLGRADELHAYRIKDLFTAADDSGEKAGRLLPMTEVAVVDRDGDKLKVRIEGWQQDGNDRVIFQRMGQRIFAAALDRSVIDQIQRHESVTDEETDLLWHRVSFDAWTATDAMSDDLAELNELGSEMFNSSCSTCHALADPGHLLANQWIGTLKAMKRFITLDDDQYYFLQTYLQQHAKDVVGSSHGT